MEQLADFLSALILVYTICIVGWVVLSLVFSLGVRVPYNRVVSGVMDFLRDVSNPYLNPGSLVGRDGDEGARDIGDVSPGMRFVGRADDVDALAGEDARHQAVDMRLGAVAEVVRAAHLDRSHPARLVCIAGVGPDRGAHAPLRAGGGIGQ